MKLKFEAGKIVDMDSHEVYDCSDKNDMRVLCSDVNAGFKIGQTNYDILSMKLHSIKLVLDDD
jgi:hypothetical protein